MNYLIMILAIYALHFFARNLSGPFNIFGLLRNKLMTNQRFGVFFFELLNCPWCLGFHCGYIIYVLQCADFNIRIFILWGLAGSASTAILDTLTNYLNK